MRTDFYISPLDLRSSQIIPDHERGDRFDHHAKTFYAITGASDSDAGNSVSGAAGTASGSTVVIGRSSR